MASEPDEKRDGYMKREADVTRESWRKSGHQSERRFAAPSSVRHHIDRRQGGCNLPALFKLVA